MKQDKNRNNIKLHEHRKNKSEEAVERNTYWAGLTLKQQLQELDRRLGKDEGAVKQRARIEVKRRNAAQKPAEKQDTPSQ